jgi:hypothetical protein
MKRQFGTLCICAVGASMVLELRYTFLKGKVKAQRGLEPPRPSLFLPLFSGVRRSGILRSSSVEGSRNSSSGQEPLCFQ